MRLVAPNERAGPAAARHDGPCVWTSEDGHAIYYVTIIDLLQSWDLGKQLERLLKLGFYCRCGSAEGLSVVEPAQYAHRFIEMVERILDQPGRVLRGSQHALLEDVPLAQHARDATSRATALPGAQERRRLGPPAVRAAGGVADREAAARAIERPMA